MHKIKILVIDDEVLCRNFVMSICRDYFTDYAIREASNPLDAIYFLSDFMPHLVITDDKMPYLKGSVFIKWLVKHSNHRDVNVCFYTSDKREDDKFSCVLKSKPDDLYSFFEARYPKKCSLRGRKTSRGLTSK